jgi:hypothetical protein
MVDCYATSPKSLSCHGDSAYRYQAPGVLFVCLHHLLCLHSNQKLVFDLKKKNMFNIIIATCIHTLSQVWLWYYLYSICICSISTYPRVDMYTSHMYIDTDIPIYMVNIAWDLLDTSFMLVVPVCLAADPVSRQLITSSIVSTNCSVAPITTVVTKQNVGPSNLDICTCTANCINFDTLDHT